ncbi:MAG: ABC transporter substrate-binding protein [Lachnospiraceae bacterium]|nr:ABC transporter substrate-binding protein [Lachnospiraceae bacterium]
MKKRTICCLMSALLAAGLLAGCGSSGSSGTTASTSAAASGETAASASTDAASTDAATESAGAQATGVVKEGVEYTSETDVNDDGTVNNPESVKVDANNLVFWSLFTGGDGEWFGKIVDQYNQEKNPDHPVSVITLVWADYYTKLQTAVATGNGPDLGVSHVSKLYELAKTGAIEPLDDYLNAAGIKLSDYYEQASVDAVTIDGKIYAIPLDTHAEVMYYNLDLLKQAGISEDDVKNISSADDFKALLQKCKDSLPEDVSPLALNSSGDDPFRIWYANYFQKGGADFVNEDATEDTMDADKAKESMEWLKGLYDDGLILPGIDDESALFQSGKAAFLFAGTWVTGTFENTDGLNFNNACYPNLFGTNQCWADSHTLIMPVNSDRTDEESQSCVNFMFSASNDYGITWAGSGQIPAAINANQSDEYKSMKGYNVVEELNNAKYAPRATNYYGGMKAEMIEALDSYWQGTADIDTALESLQGAIDNNLD